MTTGEQILKHFQKFISHESGSLKSQAIGVCPQNDPQKDHLIYIGKKEFINDKAKTNPSIVFLNEAIKENWKSENPNQCIFLCKDISLVMALVNNKFFPSSFVAHKFDNESIHPSASISATAQIGSKCIIGPHVTVSDNCVIGDNVYLGPQTTISPNARIDSDSYLESHVFVGRNCIIGKNCKIQSFTTIGSEGFGYAVHPDGQYIHKHHLRGVVLKDDVDLGTHVSIDRGTYEDTIIGKGCKVDNHCHFAHNTKIGEYCVFIAGFLCAGSVTIGDRCIFYGRVSINGHITITDDVRVYGVSYVSKSLLKPGEYFGTPAIKRKDFLKQQAMNRQLPQIKKQIKDIIKKLNS